MTHYPFQLPALLSLLLIALLFNAVSAQAEKKYEPGRSSKRQNNVPQGKVEKHEWNDSQVFPETRREYMVYVPAQYNESKPANVIVFQDGHAYLGEGGEFRSTIVMDNLIAARKIPVTIGIFINPGHRGSKLPESPWKANNRSVEYDTLSDDYAKFLLDEILPAVGKDYTLTEDPDKRAICGISSGGICAFTVAWERPDAFRRVISHVGSFTNIRGGHVYPALIRKTDKKPIRVFLQDGENDLDNQHGNWPLSNQQMDKALKFADYDYKFVYGQGGHNGNHGGAILPATLQWIWK